MSTNNIQNADTTVTVQDFIAMSNSDELTYYNYSIHEYLNGYEVFITNVIYDYESEINELVTTIQLSEIERAKYRYKPYLLAYDIYGSTELKFMIMMLNGIIDPKEFDFERVKVLTPYNLNLILSRITVVNDTFMNLNKSKIKTEIKESPNGNNIWIE